MKINENMHGECFWSLIVALGVVLNDHFEDVGNTIRSCSCLAGQYSLNLFILRPIFVRQFTHIVNFYVLL